MTAVLLSDTVWEGLSSEMTNELSGLRDGQFYKQTDTGESYFRRNGEWVFINLGLSFIKATKSGKITTDVNGEYAVVFNTSFYDDLYTVALSTQDAGVQPVVAFWSDITTTGFTITTRNTRSGLTTGNTVVSWVATRNYNP